MQEPPPAHLITLLERLDLATAGDLRRMDRRVRRLARDLPVFESVWVDALAQARVVTPFQAAEINAGRGESLRLGPFLLCGRVTWPGYAASYRARRIDSGRLVRLVVVEDGSERPEEILDRLQTLAAASAEFNNQQVVPITEAGADGGRIWAASPWVRGRTAAEWLVHNGRFPPEVVLEIARTMAAGLAVLEKAGVCHGDVSTSALMLGDGGGVVLLQPGLRAILRPEEGYARADLLPEAYDYLAPERISDGTPPTIAGDVYACGCVWWHMLCGRPPLVGGDSLGKLRAAQMAKVFDVRRLAPEVPDQLGAAVSACLEREPSGRPQSMAELAARLGTSTRSATAALSRCVARRGRPAVRWAAPSPTKGHVGRMPLWLAATAGCLLAAVTILWPVWRWGLPWRMGDQESLAGKLPQSVPGQGGGIGGTSETPAHPHPSERGYRDTIRDGAVVAAAHYEAEQPASGAAGTVPEDLVLGSGGPLRIESLRLRAGQCVRGAPGTRPLVMVPRTGLVLDAEDVRFENVDFLWDHRPQPGSTTAGQAAIVDLRRGRVEFRGCSFRSARRSSTPPVAVRWTHPVDAGEAEMSLPSGRLQLSNCVLRSVGAGVDCRTLGALAVELANTLQLGGGPLVRLDHCPRPDEPVLISLEQVTLRGGGPVLECRYEGIGGEAGEISIRAVRCAFVPRPGEALLLFSGPDPPQRMLGSIGWTGQGSLVSPQAVIAAWQGSEGAAEVLDEAAVSIDGLVRSEVGFAGNAEAGVAASRIVRWQVPLRSTDPPGMDPAALPGGATPVDGL